MKRRGDAAIGWVALTALAVLAGTPGCSSEPEVIATCEAADGVTPVCGFVNPEDLALAPGGSWMLVSQYPAGADAAGSLVGWRLADGERRVLFPPEPGATVLRPALAPDGAPDCPGPPDPGRFAPHGIDVSMEPMQPARLLVVNHGGREAVEFFEIGWASGAPALFWRGCAPLPPETMGNDVAALPGGGFVVANMMPPFDGNPSVATGLRLVFGLDTGTVLEWTPDGSWRELADSHGSLPNGVAVSPDGAEVYFGEWGGKRLVRVQRRGDPQRDSVELAHRPDNLSWTRDGRLLAAGQKGGLGKILACGQLESGTCAVPFSVVAIDPVTLDVTTLLDHPATAMGAGSAALETDDALYLGTFAGDRIARTPMPD